MTESWGEEYLPAQHEYRQIITVHEGRKLFLNGILGAMIVEA
jgi:hypothetical protein